MTAAALASPPPTTRPGLLGYAGLAVSLLLLGAIAFQMRDLDLAEVRAMVPASPVFWLVFCASYLAAPVSEWIIYRRLWAMPGAGILSLLRKLVSNELLLGYLGEVQFYGWVRQHTKLCATPFGAIKDVTILSALVGNAATLILIIFAWPLLSTTQIGLETRSVVLGLGVVLITSIAILLFRQKLFSLGRADLRFVMLCHVARVLINLGLAALMWHLVLPGVAISAWLILATLRMLLSRLPFIPNKDVVFAGLAIVLLGHDVQIAALMTMMAALMLVAHLCVGGALGLADLLQWRRRV